MVMAQRSWTPSCTQKQWEFESPIFRRWEHIFSGLNDGCSVGSISIGLRVYVIGLPKWYTLKDNWLPSFSFPTQSPRNTKATTPDRCWKWQMFSSPASLDPDSLHQTHLHGQQMRNTCWYEARMAENSVFVCVTVAGGLRRRHGSCKNGRGMVIRGMEFLGQQWKPRHPGQAVASLSSLWCSCRHYFPFAF